jgi:hypothetical protein
MFILLALNLQRNKGGPMKNSHKKNNKKKPRVSVSRFMSKSNAPKKQFEAWPYHEQETDEFLIGSIPDYFPDLRIDEEE